MWELDPDVLRKAVVYPGDYVFSWTWGDDIPVNRYFRGAEDLEALACADGVVYFLGPPQVVRTADRTYTVRVVEGSANDWGGIVGGSLSAGRLWVWLLGRAAVVPQFSSLDPAVAVSRVRAKTARATTKMWYEIAREGADVRAQAYITDALRDAAERPARPEDPFLLARAVEAAQAAVRSSRPWEAA